MNKFIVEVKDEKTKERLVSRGCTLGKPKALHNFLIVTTSLSENNIRNIEGVLLVEEEIQDVPEEDLVIKEVSENWFLPALSRSKNEYIYNKTGRGVDIYIMDSGIRTTHNEFTDRVYTLYSHDDLEYGGSIRAPNHGTMAAGCAAGTVHGVAKEATLINIRYNWTNFEGLKAMDTVLSDHIAKDSNRGSILSMSFSTTSSTAYDRIIRTLIDHGVVCVAAASNNAEKSVRYPANNDRCIAVGCLENKSGKMYPVSYTNYGPDIQVMAPGHAGIVASVDDDNTFGRASGTSSACPVVAGVLAMIMEDSVKLTGREEVLKVKEKLIDICTPDAVLVGKYADTPNRVPKVPFEHNVIKPPKEEEVIKSPKKSKDKSINTKLYIVAAAALALTALVVFVL